MKILITGGAGYKGNILARKFLELGYKVTILDNFLFGFTPILDLVSHKNFSIINKDIRNIDNQDIKSQDIIYHLAAMSGLTACRDNPHDAKSINVDATQKLIKLLSLSQTLVFASTTSLYGNIGKSVDEDTKIKPISLYGITKYKAEKIVAKHKNSIILRFATLFGISPRMRTDLLVNNFVYRSINDRSLVIFNPESVRTYLHVKDAIDAYQLIIKKIRLMNSKIFNVGSNKLNFSKLDLAKKIQQFVEFEIFQSQLCDIDQRNFFIKYDRIKSLGFKTQVSMNQGIKELVKLYSFNPALNEN